MNQPIKEKKLKYIFGPVPSNRLGISLGVDLVPYKTCSYDCVYCQIGKTTHKTIERKEYVNLEEVLSEFEQKLSEGLQANYITLTGSGEPTLNSRCGEIIRAIKQLTEIPIAVIHNGSLLWDPSVREDLAAADLVIPSLDAGDALTFEKVNRPQRSISYDKMLSGLIAFSKAFQGKIWLEVLLLGGSTATETEVAKIAAQVRKIRPNLVHLKIVARSSSMNFDYEFSETEMLNLMKMFGETTQIIAGFSGIRDKMEFSVRMEEVLGLLNQQSCTLEEVSIALGMHRREAAKYLNLLLRQGVITRKKTAEEFFYASLKR